MGTEPGSSERPAHRRTWTCTEDSGGCRFVFPSTIFVGRGVPNFRTRTGQKGLENYQWSEHSLREREQTTPISNAHTRCVGQPLSAQSNQYGWMALDPTPHIRVPACNNIHWTIGPPGLLSPDRPAGATRRTRHPLWSSLDATPGLSPQALTEAHGPPSSPTSTANGSRLCSSRGARYPRVSLTTPRRAAHKSPGFASSERPPPRSACTHQTPARFA